VTSWVAPGTTKPVQSWGAFRAEVQAVDARRREAALRGERRLPAYGSTATLDAAVADTFGDVREVVAEAERLVLAEARASAYYREHPDLLHPGHPWAEHVRAGRADWLGWRPDEVPSDRLREVIEEFRVLSEAVELRDEAVSRMEALADEADRLRGRPW